MPTVVDERWDSGSGTHDGTGYGDSVTLTFNVVGTESEEEAHEAVRGYIPAYHRRWMFRSYKLDFQGGDAWHVTAEYAYGPGTGATLVKVSTRGGTKHVTQAIEQVVYDAADIVDPDPFEGAIGVNGDTVEGCDVIVPTLHFAEVHQQPYDRAIATDFLNAVVALTGTVNAETFRGFRPGEVLFLGADWEYEAIDVPEVDPDLTVAVTYEFAAAPNKENFTVGGINVDEKWGWDYLWVRYQEKADAATKQLVKKPYQVCVATVYEDESFVSLEIGS